MILEPCLFLFRRASLMGPSLGLALGLLFNPMAAAADPEGPASIASNLPGAVRSGAVPMPSTPGASVDVPLPVLPTLAPTAVASAATPSTAAATALTASTAASATAPANNTGTVAAGAIAATASSPTAGAGLNPIPAPPGLTPTAAAGLTGTGRAAPSSALPPLKVLLPKGAAPTPPAHGLSTPLYLTAEAGNRSVELSWYPALPARGGKPVAGYLVFRGLPGRRISPQPINLTRVTQTYYLDDDTRSRAGPANRVTYVYRVRAYDIDGLLSPYSLTVSARPSGPLLPPGRFRVRAGDGFVRITWTAPFSTGDADLAGYELYRGPDPAHLERYRFLPASALAFRDTGLQDGRVVAYALSALTTDRKESSRTNPVRVAPFKPLRAPTGLAGVGLGEDLIRLTWSPPPAGGTFPLRGYDIYRSTGGPVDLDAPPLNKKIITSTSYEDDSDHSTQPPSMGHRYRYVVVGVDSEGGLSLPSLAARAAAVASITKLEVGTFDIMSGNTLQIQGRKTISVSDTWMLWRQNPGNNYGTYTPSVFALNQQLQVQLSGQVGRKIKVDVDYDDSAMAGQQQKISVVYGGDSQEVVKQFAFGDIQMDLDSSRTQFASYNKSLFGAQLKIQSPDGRLRLTAVGAQTQGFTETKTFTGGYEEVMNGTVPGMTYPDTAFTPYQYYYLSREEDLVEGVNSVVPGSVAVYVDEPGVSNMASNRVTVGNGSTTFNFVPLVPNQDYTVNYKDGLVALTTPMQANYNIFVAFKTEQAMTGCGCSSIGYDARGNVEITDDANGTDANLQDNNTSGVTDPGHDLIQYGSQNGSTGYDGHMSCQFYSMGQREILDPSQDPNFKFIIYGPNNSVVYQLGAGTDYTGVVNFNTTMGIMVFRVPYPFQQGNSQAQMTADYPVFSDVGVPYNGNKQDCYNLVQRVSNYSIYVEFQDKMTDYQLRPNIVNGSDVVTVNGRRVIRNQDYFLDYTTGILVFNNPDLVSGNATVQATYEYMPFGSQFASTVWGGRGEYDFNNDLSVGATYINDSANGAQDTPQIGAGVYSLQVLDGDVQAKVPQPLLDAMTRPISPRSGFLKIHASAEAAESWYNPNTYNRNNENGVAMVDDFESVDSIVSGSTLRDTWFPASIPNPAEIAQLATGPNPVNSNPVPSNRTFTHYWTNPLQAHDSAVLVQAGQNPLINQLQWDWAGYTPTGAGQGGKWDGYVYSFGPTPNLAISQSNQIQIWLRTTAPVTLHLDCGQINEDAVDNGQLATESPTGYLAAGEDIGIDNPSTVGSPYPCPQNDPGLYTDPTYWGWNNGILDTEDFEQTGVLDKADNYYYFSVNLNPSAQNPAVNNGYQEVTFDLTQPSTLPPGYAWGTVTTTAGTILSTQPGNSNYYTNISRMRLWMDGVGASGGSLIIESVQFVGNKWQVRADPNVPNAYTGLSNTVSTAQFQVQAVNGLSPVSLTAGVPYVPDTDFFTIDSTDSVSTETALELQYAETASDFDSQPGPYQGEPAFQARRILGTGGTPTDFAEYQNMRLDIFEPNYNSPAAGYPYGVGKGVVRNQAGETLLVRLAADDQDYFEYAVPLDSVGVGSWQTVTLPLDGSGGNRVQVGTPYLRQINYVSFAVRAPGINYAMAPPYYQEVLWLNNLRVTDPVVRQGGAQRFDINYNLMGGKITVDQSYQEVDSDYIQIDQQDNPPLQHSVNQAVNANVNALSWMPATFSYNADQLYTDSAYLNDPFYSQNFSLPNQFDDKTSASVSFTRIPGLMLGASGFLQHERQIFLPQYTAMEQLNLGMQFNPNNVQQHSHEQFDAGYTVPARIPVVGSNSFKAEFALDTAREAFDQPITITGTTQFANSEELTRTLTGSYNGTFRAGKWLVLSPSLTYTRTDADGNISAPTVLPGATAAYTLDVYGRVSVFTPQQSAINPSLQAQLGDLGPVRDTRLSYNFTQNTDYILNQVETPGSLNASTDLDLSSLGKGWSKAPPLNISQVWQVDSIINDGITVRGPVETAMLQNAILSDPSLSSQYAGTLANSALGGLSAVPNLALENHAPWYDSPWMPRFALAGRDFFNGAYSIEDLASSATRRNTTSISSHFNLDLLPGWQGMFSPRATYSDARDMTAPEQVTEDEQTSVGADIVFQRPHIPFWNTLRPDNLTLDGSYSFSSNFIDDIEIPPYLSSLATTYNFTASMPMRPSDRSTVTASMAAAVSDNTIYQFVNSVDGVASVNNTLSLTPAMEWVYIYNMTKPIRLPNFWPFYGREMRLSQALRFDNKLTATINDAYQNGTAANLENTASDLYTLVNSISYNVLQNVRINFSFEQDFMMDPYANQAINQPGGYYSIKASLGADASF